MKKLWIQVFVHVLCASYMTMNLLLLGTPISIDNYQERITGILKFMAPLILLFEAGCVIMSSINKLHIVMRMFGTILFGPLAFLMLSFLFSAPMSIQSAYWSVVMSCNILLLPGSLIDYQFSKMTPLITEDQKNSDKRPSIDSLVERMTMVQIALPVFCVWASAIVIPLDWDRPWQLWPICGTYGLLFGTILASVYSVCYLVFHTLITSKPKTQ